MPAALGLETKLSSGFPGGNIRVIRNEGSRLELAPDLRGGRPWFYWQFEAQTDGPGRVEFVFADAPQLGMQGPACSADGGKSWRWLGAGSTQFAGAPNSKGVPAKSDSFVFDFTTAGQMIRFCSAIPYLQGDLDAFLASQKGNPQLTVGSLTKTAKGRNVELLRIGAPGPGVQAVLMTARHHACESMASYVLEGFLREALSESPAARAFRSRYVLYAVPLIDKDGVQEGDQGKGRPPHDHNRDYGPTNLYPEVRAVQALARDNGVELALDFHCPVIRGESHTTFYFDGLGVQPTLSNVVELSEWLAEEGPPVFSRGPNPWLKKPPAVPASSNMPFSIYFASQKSVRMAATLEVPYAMAYSRFDAALARDYGASLLRAWERVRFTAAGQPRVEGHAAFDDMRKSLSGLARSKPGEAERQLSGLLDDGKVPGVYRSEARLQRGVVRFREKRYAEALSDFDGVATHDAATTRQKGQALSLRLQVVCRDPESGIETVERALADFKSQPYPAPDQAVAAHGAVSVFYENTNRLERAIDQVREQLAAAGPYEKGRLLNRMAGLHDKRQQPDDALRCRREAVAHLRRQLDPVPVGVFGPMMGADLFEALSGLPAATEKEKEEAADIVRNHPLKLPDYIKRVTPDSATATK